MLFGRYRAPAALGGCVTLATLFGAPRPAHAIGIEDVGDETLTIDVTNTATFNYHFNNRNSPDAGLTAPGNVLDDAYGEWLDRLNVQLYYWRFRLGVRLDTSTYFALPAGEDIRAEASRRLGPTATGVEVNDYYNAFQRDLHTRYRQTVYPAKLFVGYTAPGVDITVGDFYAQLGRGLVFSVRKIDELATDTTVRGIKASLRPSLEDAQLNVTVFAGQMNPIRVDETSGRRLHGDGSPLFFGFPSADDFRIYSFDSLGHAGYEDSLARPSYLEDSVLGASVETGPGFMTFGVHGSYLARKSYDEAFVLCQSRAEANCGSRFPVFEGLNASRQRNGILTMSASVNIPNLFDIGDAYVEVAGQHMGDGAITGIGPGGEFTRVPDLNGQAVYATTTLRGGPVSVNFEGKHYRSFNALAANINANSSADPIFGAPEFDIVGYNQVPSAEPTYVEPLGSPNLCNTGGRAKVDLSLGGETTVYAWVGHYLSYSEIDPTNYQCQTDDRFRTNAWDSAAGTELALEEGKTHVKAWIGLRSTTRGESIENANTGGETDTFYREGYIRYDVTKHIAGDFSIQAQGNHRHRYEPLLYGDSWNEGENYTALQWSPHFAFIFGYEYVARQGCIPDPETKVCHYFNGGVQFRANGIGDWAGKIFDTVSFFIGQRRGAIRCVSGVCRQFPPFEGAKLEWVTRF